MITEKKVQSLQIINDRNYLLVNITSGTDFILTHGSQEEETLSICLDLLYQSFDLKNCHIFCFLKVFFS